jgi:chromate transporter
LPDPRSGRRPSRRAPARSTGAEPALQEEAGDADLVPFGEAVRTWGAISLQTFGGPAGQIAVMQRILVDEKRWIGQRRFLHALNYCMLLPGPEAQQLAIYIGWLLNGLRGGLVAGVLFVLPGMIALLALSAIYVGYGDTTAVASILAGVAPAILAIVVQAVLRVGRRALARPALVWTAVAAFVALAVFGIPFPLVIAAAAIGGLVMHPLAPHRLAEAAGARADDGPAPVIADDALHAERPTLSRTAKVGGIGLAAWLIPILAVVALAGTASIFFQQGLFFSATALVSFGGAYAVLTFVAQRAVEVYGWLLPGEMIKGLAMAETTPGPLIMVVQFVAFLGAFRDPGTLDPWVAATLGALLTTWVIFAPGFVLILLGAPYVERLRGNQRLSAALTGITAAVVGIIANLAFFFAVHTLFAETVRVTSGPLDLELPDLGTLRPLPVLIAIAAAVMVFRLRWSILRTLATCAVLGLAAGLLGVS